ncbi:phosphatidylserine decarboxylase family protein [Terriglobus aquaticus]|uniref:Phosphatidylserine decarboxylase proenzyme n=1 Tax=Terriglobus aquaticus TaxID=940139 RepID=A0ABW9KL59_9BACT|nr:phosphatidylserine decarboxylase family protein [Terriglobus aquaticus]
MVRDGIYYALGLAVVSYLLFRLTGSSWIAGIPVLLALFFLWFFRDPPRRVPTEANVVVSPADGKVTEADWIETPQGSRLRLSIFLNVFDVHVNRTPISGTVTQVNYKQGMFLNAMRADSNVLNEQNVMVIEDGGYSVQVKQIAGLLARRIVCWVKPGDVLQKGDRFGLIKFGSRVDVLLPPDANLRVKKGDRVRGGASIIATMPVASATTPEQARATVAGV